MSNTKIIARNTGWYGIENVISFVVTIFTSIAVARTLGPAKMGYIIYVIWLTGVVSSLGSLGIPATTRKYMAEFLGKGDGGTARYIYSRTLLLQVGIATLATIGIVAWVLANAPTGYRAASVWIALSIWPAMVNAISAQANAATEQLSRNLPASAVSTVVYFLGIGATVVFGWGVVGVGVATFAMRFVDFIVRLIPTMRRNVRGQTAHAFPAGLRRRMMNFAWQSVVSMLAALIVWERSEFFLLKYLCSDIRQIAYYSVAFSMAERLLLPSTIFGSAIGTTIFAQYGRDKSRIPEIAASAFRYIALVAIPLHVIFSALAVPALLLLYGHQYRGAATAVSLAPLLCMPKAFMAPAQSLLQSGERQSYVIGATLFAGVIDIGVASWLIRSHGAVGACIGSGAAQVTAAVIVWAVSIRLYGVKLPWGMIGKVAVASIISAAVAHSITSGLSPVRALLAAGAASVSVLLSCFYLMHVLDIQDQGRIKLLSERLPKPIATLFDRASALLISKNPVSVNAEGI